MSKKHFKHDWASILVDFVKKKDLDGGDWANCWNEDYDWTAFDKYLIANYFDELVDWGIIRFDITEKDAIKDLKLYEAHYDTDKKDNT